MAYVPDSVKAETRRSDQPKTAILTYILPIEDVPLLAHWVLTQKLQSGDTLTLEFSSCPGKDFIDWFRSCLKYTDLKISPKKDLHILVVSNK